MQILVPAKCQKRAIYASMRSTMHDVVSAFRCAIAVLGFWQRREIAYGIRVLLKDRCPGTRKATCVDEIQLNSRAEFREVIHEWLCRKVGSNRPRTFNSEYCIIQITRARPIFKSTIAIFYALQKTPDQFRRIPQHP